MAAAGGLLCMGLFLAFKKGQREKAGLFSWFCSCLRRPTHWILGLNMWPGVLKVLKKAMKKGQRIARKAIVMLGDYRVAGVGVGNFQYAYPRYQAEEERKGYVRFAHNDWAQFLSEAGITGFALLLARPRPLSVCHHKTVAAKEAIPLPWA